MFETYTCEIGIKSTVTKNFHLSLLGKDLVPTRCARDLGVIFDDRLTFSDHTVKVQLAPQIFSDHRCEKIVVVAILVNFL